MNTRINIAKQAIPSGILSGSPIGCQLPGLDGEEQQGDGLEHQGDSRVGEEGHLKNTLFSLKLSAQARRTCSSQSLAGGGTQIGSPRPLPNLF